MRRSFYDNKGTSHISDELLIRCELQLNDQGRNISGNVHRTNQDVTFSIPSISKQCIKSRKSVNQKGICINYDRFVTLISARVIFPGVLRPLISRLKSFGFIGRMRAS